MIPDDFTRMSGTLPGINVPAESWPGLFLSMVSPAGQLDLFSGSGLPRETPAFKGHAEQSRRGRRLTMRNQSLHDPRVVGCNPEVSSECSDALKWGQPGGGSVTWWVHFRDDGGKHAVIFFLFWRGHAAGSGRNAGFLWARTSKVAVKWQHS